VRRHHTGSGRAKVIPDDWQEQHAGVIAQTFTATVTIGDPEAAATPFNDTTGQTTVTPAAPVYSGSAAIAVVARTDRIVAAADELESTRIYEVTLPWAVAGIKPGHVVHVVTSSDTMLVGRDLAIDTAQLGDRRFSRVLHATLND
jgi:hypothetical protein